MTHLVFLTLCYKTNELVHIYLFLKVTIVESNLLRRFETTLIQIGNQH